MTTTQSDQETILRSALHAASRDMLEALRDIAGYDGDEPAGARLAEKADRAVRAAMRPVLVAEGQVGHAEAAQAIGRGEAHAHSLWCILSRPDERDGFMLKPSMWEGPGQYQNVHLADGRQIYVKLPHLSVGFKVEHPCATGKSFAEDHGPHLARREPARATGLAALSYIDRVAPDVDGLDDDMTVEILVTAKAIRDVRAALDGVQVVG